VRRDDMKNPLLLCLALAFSLPLVPTPAHATPHAGSKELRIGQELEPPLNLSNGYIHLSPEHGDGRTGLGFGAGIGYFVNDAIELGISLNLQMLKIGDSALTGLGAAPFVRFMFVQARIGYFFEADASFQRFSNDNGTASQRIVTVGGDLGLEFFVTEDWAVRVAPTFRRVILSGHVSDSPIDDSGNRYGLSWGLACYF
jgi:hypothetical protein